MSFQQQLGSLQQVNMEMLENLLMQENAAQGGQQQQQHDKQHPLGPRPAHLVAHTHAGALRVFPLAQAPGGASSSAAAAASKGKGKARTHDEDPRAEDTDDEEDSDFAMDSSAEEDSSDEEDSGESEAPNEEQEAGAEGSEGGMEEEEEADQSKSNGRKAIYPSKGKGKLVTTASIKPGVLAQVGRGSRGVARERATRNASEMDVDDE